MKKKVAKKKVAKKKKPVKKKKPKSVTVWASFVSNEYYKNWIGAERWEKLLAFLKENFEAKTVFLGYHQQGKGVEIYLNSPTGKHLGNLAAVEAMYPKPKKRKKNDKSKSANNS
jgi:hypothetical protein